MGNPPVPSVSNLHLAEWARELKPSALQESLEMLDRPGLISLALGLPALEFFPSNAYQLAIEEVFRAGPGILQYSRPLKRLKEQVVELMAARGVQCRPEQVFLTAGAQQGVNLLARVLLDQGGSVAMEEMVYTGFQQVLEPFQPRVLTVPADFQSGMDVNALEELLKDRARPAFIYAVPDGHNPLGVSLSLEKRRRLVEIATRYQTPVIEDDAYGFLQYEARPYPPLRALAEDYIFYVGSFSKILAPALRVGWIVAPEWLMSRLSVLKESIDINMTTFAQQTISKLIDLIPLDDHLALLRREYRARRNVMLSSLESYFPEDALWGHPSAGFFIWVEFDHERDTASLLKQAVEREGVTFIPGTAFSVGRTCRGDYCMRLNFSHCDADLIQEGVRRLGHLLESQA
jgi:2-aminoadipate transaminase